MLKETVFFFDSGVGGLPYCAAFSRRNPGTPVAYVADNRHFPYGPRPPGEIEALLRALVAALAARFGARLVVLACNTASVSALEALRKSFPGIAFVGTVPAVRPAVLASRSGVAGVLGTERTVTDPYVRRLCEDACRERGGPCRLVCRAAPELVEFVEHEFWGADERRKEEAAGEYVDYFRARGADALVLGCTHFLLLAPHFRRRGAGDMPVFDSIDGVCAQIERVYAALPPAPGAGRPAPRGILLTSDAACARWREAAALFHMTCGPLEGAGA